MLPMFMAISNQEEEVALAIWNEYKDIMYKIALQYLGNQQDAEDAVQDTLVRIIDHIDKFYGEKATNVKSLIYIYTKGTCINNYNKRKKDRSKCTSLYDYDNEDEVINIVDDKELDPRKLLENKETTKALIEIIDEMNDKYKDVIILKYFHGYKDAEIAEALNITIDNVGVRANRARKQLAKLAEKSPYSDLLMKGCVSNG